IKSFIRRNTPTRPGVKSELIPLQERERQRLESLRKKQEAEEQRKKKVEEEKRRRQAEMKQKREERLRKALQARERMEQMEEEKKKRMEQKMLQNDEKVRSSHAREEKVVEELSRKKLSKKLVEANGRRQKALRGGYRGLFFLQKEDELEQPEPLQKRREGEVKERGRRVLELKNLVEQQQAEQMKERAKLEGFLPRDHKQQGKEKAPLLQLESAALAVRHVKVGSQSALEQRLCGQLGRHRVDPGPVLPGQVSSAQPGLLPALIGALCFQRPVSCSKGMREPGSPKVSENNYGMDLNSDDSTDDENDPRKPVPAWADGSPLHQAILHQYYHPVNVDQLFGLIPSPKLEDIFGKSKPRYFKRTSSAVWHSPP
ncbi:INCE protein, partial [Bucorvus abyssinicus]|nr:INCE protein [Bucorvus abyssinicus]